MSTADMALWLAGVVIEAVLVALLLKGRAFRSLPVFCAYVCWTLVSDVAALLANCCFSNRFFDVYVAQSLLDVVLQFGVLVELAWSVLRPYWPALPRGALLVIALSVLAAGALVWPFATIPGIRDFPPEWQFLMRLQGSASILRVLFFVDLLGLSKVLEVSWRNRELQIALGLGFYSLVSLVVSFVHSSHMDSPNYHLYDQLVAASYFCSMLYWAVCFAQNEAPRRQFSAKAQDLLFTVAGVPRDLHVPGDARDDIESKERD